MLQNGNGQEQLLTMSHRAWSCKKIDQRGSEMVCSLLIIYEYFSFKLCNIEDIEFDAPQMRASSEALVFADRVDNGLSIIGGQCTAKWLSMN